MRLRSTDWSAVYLESLIGRWLLIHNHRGNWRGFITSVSLDTENGLLYLETRDLQRQLAPALLYYAHHGPIPPIPIDYGSLQIRDGDIHWRAHGLHARFCVPRPQPMPARTIHPGSHRRSIDPTRMRSSGGARLRRFI